MRHVPQRWLALFVLESLFVLALVSMAQAQDGRLFGLGSRTLGGRFTWSDEVVYQDYRIQRSAVVGHYRLLDPEDRRVSFGTLENCLAALEDVKVIKQLPPLPKEVVIVLHGLGASRQWMNELADYLEKEGNLKVVNVGYPSTMGNISEHAQTLVSVIRHLEGVETVNFVAHSMGNIVIRHALTDLAALPASEQPQIAYRRFVMIAPPNHGAVVADKVDEHRMLARMADTFGGEVVDQLAPGRGWKTLEQYLTTPDFEFGIIAGGSGDDEGYLPHIPGDDDMLLSVATTKLAGASDFIQVKGIHQTLPKNDQVQQYALRYLLTGAFLPSGNKHPIVATDEPPVAAQP